MQKLETRVLDKNPGIFQQEDIVNLQNSPGFALDLTPMQSCRFSSMGLPRNVSCHLTSQHPRARGGSSKTLLSAWQAVSACFVGTFIVGFWYRSMWIGSFVALRGWLFEGGDHQLLIFLRRFHGFFWVVAVNLSWSFLFCEGGRFLSQKHVNLSMLMFCIGWVFPTNDASQITTFGVENLSLETFTLNPGNVGGDLHLLWKM